MQPIQRTGGDEARQRRRTAFDQHPTAAGRRQHLQHLQRRHAVGAGRQRQPPDMGGGRRQALERVATDQVQRFRLVEPCGQRRPVQRRATGRIEHCTHRVGSGNTPDR